MMPSPDGPYAVIVQCTCPDCRELITSSETRFCGRLYTIPRLGEERIPVHCRHCGFTWSLLGKDMSLLLLDFTEFREAA
jgi:hypothetical protein